ncbi:MAG: KaiB [Phenylobacterium sp.]|jgi:circadian clock protein KaiB|nr:KaiB [Phenylobacterium sp.]
MSDAPDADAGPKYVLRLYITGTTPRSLRAIANLRQILSTQPSELFDLQVIDIYQQPEAASEHQIIAAPTLVKLFPEPVRRIIGDLSDNARVLRGLEIEPRSAEAVVGEPDLE